MFYNDFIGTSTAVNGVTYSLDLIVRPQQWKG